MAMTLPPLFDWTTAIKTALILLVLPAITKASDSPRANETSTTQQYTGWRNGSDTRGTMTIIWNCLATLLACTWTILHLNVPGYNESYGTILLRKIKWTITTLLCPELVFAKAICELEAAVYDLYILKENEHAHDWEVDFGRGCLILFKIFRLGHRLPRHSIQYVKNMCRDVSLTTLSLCGKAGSTETPTAYIKPSSPLDGYRRTSSTVQITEQHQFLESRDTSFKWTLTHTYFANMGGLIAYTTADKDTSVPITLRALWYCCMSKKHTHIYEFPTEKQIKDKSKADWFTKTITMVQILRLLCTMASRAIRGLPISQLEICTAAFSILSIATYLANLHKPKDVVVPIHVTKSGKYHIDFGNPRRSYGIPFITMLFKPLDRKRSISRIANDSLRAANTKVAALVISTMCFGAFHCLAWNQEFPTTTEKIMWMVASVMSVALPILQLVLFGSYYSIIAGRDVGPIINAFKRATEEHGKNNGKWPICYDENGLPYAQVEVLYTRRDTSDGEESWVRQPMIHELIGNFHVQLGIVSCGLNDLDIMANYDDIRYEWEKLQRIYETLRARGLYVPLALPSDMSRFIRVQSYRKLESRNKDWEWYWHMSCPLLSNLLNHPDKVIEHLLDSLEENERQTQRLGRWCYIINGAIYGVARVTILALAFAAFRKQEERLYEDTWASNIPGIG